MPPQNTQPNSQLPPDQLSASLAFANNLQSQGLPPPQAPETPTNQTSLEDTQAQIKGLETRLMDELQTLRAEMKDQGDGKKELADLKKQIEQILNSNE